MRIGIFSDLHLGLRQYGLKEREEDFYQQYWRAIDTFINQKVDLVIIGGDVFDQPRPSPEALKVFSNGLIQLKEHNINVLNVVGNHAMIQSPNFVTADEFVFNMSSLKNCLLLESHKESPLCYLNEKDDVAVFGLPYFFNFQIDDFIDTVNRLNKDAKNFEHKRNILVLHQSFKEFCGFTGETLSINDIETDGFDLIICGHIHERKLFELDNGTIFLQPGSLERLNIAEARDEENQGKGIFIVDTDNISTESLKFCRIRSPRKFLMADMYMDKSEDIMDMEKEILSEVKNLSIPPILFLNVHDTSNSFRELIDLTNQMNKECLTVHFKYFDESVQEEYDIVSSPEDLPTSREALRIALNPLDEDEAKLGLDLYDLLKDGKDVTKLLDDFLKKRTEEIRDEFTRNYNNEELDELEEYFNSL